MQTVPEITSDWLSGVKEGLCTPLKVIEAMRLDVDRIELGVGQFTDIVCRSIENGHFRTMFSSHVQVNCQRASNDSAVLQSNFNQINNRWKMFTK